MFKEVVISGAIILGFFINLAWVAHPDVTSYTIAFVISLVVEAPFVLWWRFRTARKELEESGLGDEEEGAVTLIGVGRLLGFNNSSSFVPWWRFHTASKELEESGLVVVEEEDAIPVSRLLGFNDSSPEVDLEKGLPTKVEEPSSDDATGSSGAEGS